jgi:DNA-binding LacI/PurR family transcriptional regulator
MKASSMKRISRRQGLTSVSTTIQDIAMRANVSPRAVSYALNGTGRISQVTRKRVRALADQLGYRTNTAARTTRTGRFGAVGLLLSSREGRSNLPSRLLAGIHDALARHDLMLNLVQLPDDNFTDSTSIPRILREKACDGLLVDFILGVPQRMLELINEHRVPAVFMNSRHDADAVYPDDFQAGQIATRKLIDAGHRRIAYVSHDISHETPHYSVMDRRAGYESAMLEAGLATLTSTHRRSKHEFLDVFTGWLTSPDRPTAVVTYSPSMVAVSMVAAARLGLRFPEDLSIVTFASQPFGLVRDIDTLITPEEEMGRLAVEMLLTRINDGQHTPSRRLAFTWSPGESIAPGPGADPERSANV